MYDSTTMTNATLDRPNHTLNASVLIQQLAELLGGKDKAELWLKSPHPFLGYQTPQSYLDREELWEIEYLIQTIGTGQPS